MKELADWLTRGASLEVGGKLPYLGSGSIVGIEALARLAAAGVEITNDPGAMGGGEDPFADYFGKVEAAGADQANKFLQWADDQIRRGAKMAKIQGEEISLIDYKDRLEKIRRRKHQAAPQSLGDLSNLSEQRSLADGIRALRAAQKADDEAKWRQVEREFLDALTPDNIRSQLLRLGAKDPDVAIGVNSLLELNVPNLLAETLSFLQNAPLTDEKIGKLVRRGLRDDKGRSGVNVCVRVENIQKIIPRIEIDSQRVLRNPSPEYARGTAYHSALIPYNTGDPMYSSVGIKCRQLRVCHFKVESVVAWGGGIFTGKEGESGIEVYRPTISIQTLLQGETPGLLIEARNDYPNERGELQPLKIHDGIFSAPALVPATALKLRQTLIRALDELEV